MASKLPIIIKRVHALAQAGGPRHLLIMATFVVLFGSVGTYFLVGSHAATPTTSLEAESGALSGSVTQVNDASASGGAAVQFGTSLPSGVTLQSIDGGTTFYNSFPNMDARFKIANFFPISVDSEFDATRYANIAKLGVNGINGPYNGTSQAIVDAAKAANLWIVDKTVPTISTAGTTVVGYKPFDELDGKGNTCAGLESAPVNILSICQSNIASNNNAVTPAGITQMQNAIKASDSTRFTLAQYTTVFACNNYPPKPTDPSGWGHAMDVISYDWYPLTDKYNYGNCPKNHAVFDQYAATQEARGNTGYTRPVWVYIETSKLFPPGGQASGYLPTGADIEAEVWNAVIGGAQGIEYFNNDFSAGACNGQHVLADTNCYVDQHAGILSVDTKLAAHAAIINASYASGYETHGSANLHTMVKWYGNTGYIFAIPNTTTAQNNVTFQVAGNPSGTVTVLDEGRTLPLTNGSFTDNFANQNVVHIYKIN